MYKEGASEIQQIDSRLAQLDSEKISLLARKQELLSSQPTNQNLQSLSTQGKASLFKKLFRGQEGAYANRWKNAAGRSGYAVACFNDWKPGVCGKPKVKCSKCPNKAFKPLDDEAVYNHLSGSETVGVYPLMLDNHCWFLAADFDKSDWQDAVRATGKICQEYNIPHAIERSRSGNGAHLRVFFSEPVPAVMARRLGFALLDRAMEIQTKLSFDSYDRFFPNQDTLPTGGFGNLIALPLQQDPRQHGNSVFVGNDFTPYSDQWSFLHDLKQLSLSEVGKLVHLFNQEFAKPSANDNKKVDFSEQP